MDRKELITKANELAQRLVEREQDETNFRELQEALAAQDREITELYRELKGHFEPQTETLEWKGEFQTPPTNTPRMLILDLLQKTGQRLGASHITKACGLEPRKAGPHFAALSRAGLIRKTEDHKWVAA